MTIAFDDPAVIYDEPSITYDGLGIEDFPLDACVLSAEVQIGGTVIASPDFTLPDEGASSVVNGQGRVWTLNDGAAFVCPSYGTPSTDPAPWFDPAVPESSEFAGFLMLSMTGQDTRPTQRSVTNAVTGGGVFGPQRVVPRTLVVQGVLLGSSCCGVSYGLKWLGQVLDGCGTPGCDGVDLEMFDCCPSDETDYVTMQQRYLRTARRAALISGPTVTRRAGDGCQGGCTADVLFVEFVISLAEPWWWLTPETMMVESLPTDDGSCVDWTTASSSACDRLAACSTDDDCADPECLTPTAPVIPSPTSCYCVPLAANTEYFDIDTSEFAANFEILPLITVSAGASDLRRATVTFYERTAAQEALTCEEVATANRCSPHSVYHAGFVPSEGTLVFDGQIRRALVQCNGTQERSSNAWGRDGAPIAWNPLGCGKSFCVSVETDSLAVPAADSTFTLELSGREM